MDLHVSEGERACDHLTGHWFRHRALKCRIRTPLNSIICVLQSQFGQEYLIGASHTSRIGTGSCELLSNLTVEFIAKTKGSAAATIKNPKLSSKNDDRVDFHHSETVRRGARFGCRSGDVSSGMSPPSLGRDVDSEDDDACPVMGV